MDSLWPWLAVAGVGALHGLNPASGWMLAAAWGLRSQDRAQALRALLPIAAGHVAAVALVAAAVALGLALDRTLLQVLAGGALLLVAGAQLRRRRPARAWAAAGHAGLALWSFIMSSAHGAGLMLVPALMPLCLGAGPGGEVGATGPLALALVAVGVHGAAMLAVTGALAIGVCRGCDCAAGWLRRLLKRVAWWSAGRA